MTTKSTKGASGMFEDLLATYERLEPSGSDTWNPLHNEIELWHRVRLYLELRRALEAIAKPLEALKVLDVGCGTGRSTRALLEFGVRPENVLGLDLRKSAIDHARAVNPAISYLALSNLDGWPTGRFDLCMQCTAFSSILGHQPRLALAQKMMASIGPGAHLYWWDLVDANDFAGGDRLEPVALFGGLDVVFERTVCIQPAVVEAVRPGRRPRGLSVLQRRFGFPMTHVSALFQK
jgi:SAM-dependent methyltransferase